MNRCHRCHTAVKSGHGYCASCAIYVDAFDSGANYADDFEGVTDDEAQDFAIRMIEEGSMDQFFEDFGPRPVNAREQYLEGLVAGLKAAAKENYRFQREQEEDEARYFLPLP